MITINIYYKGDTAVDFMKEMESSGVADEVRAEKGCLRYDYFLPVNDDKTVLLIDTWESQQALDEHHKSGLMTKIAELRDKYDVHMVVEQYERRETQNTEYIRK